MLEETLYLEDPTLRRARGALTALLVNAPPAQRDVSGVYIVISNSKTPLFEKKLTMGNHGRCEGIDGADACGNQRDTEHGVKRRCPGTSPANQASRQRSGLERAIKKPQRPNRPAPCPLLGPILTAKWPTQRENGGRG
jgi:hypothetical protein